MIALTALEELLNRLPYGVGLFRYGGSGESEYLNDQYFNLIGYSREEYAKFKNGPIDKLIHHDDLSDVQKCKDQLKHENHTEVEYRIICRGERTLWIKMDASKIEIDGDFMVLSSFRDITKEKLAEMQMSIISNSINSGISMIELRGPEGVPLFTNDAFFDLLGVSVKIMRKILITIISMLSVRRIMIKSAVPFAGPSKTKAAILSTGLLSHPANEYM